MVIQSTKSLNATRSATDCKDYELVTLSNGLRTLLVSSKALLAQHQQKSGKDGSSKEEGSIKAAAALAVQVGSFFDPPDAEGTAHYLEHMLFMGSAKYPAENHYDAFVSSHGGSCNAFTEGEYTCYSFDVNASALSETLDIFAQCFVSPLLSADALGREVEAIESEFQLAAMEDDSRLQQLMSHQFSNDHLLHKFSWGNKRSLVDIPRERDVDVRALLRLFHSSYYRPGASVMVVTGPQSLDELRDMVVESFDAWSPDSTPIHDKPVPPLKVPPMVSPNIGPSFDPFPASELLTVSRLVPVKNAHKLFLYWSLPPSIAEYRAKSLDVLSHCLGHEGRGSLLSLLKSLSLAHSLSCGVAQGSNFDENSSLSLFNLTVKLTAKGLANWASVVRLVNEYLCMLEREANRGDSEGEGLRWVFDELQAMGEISYKYADEEESYDLAERLCPMLLPLFGRVGERETDLLASPYLFYEWRPREVLALLKDLSPGRCKVYLSSRVFGPNGGDYDDEEEDGSDEGSDEGSAGDSEGESDDYDSEDDSDSEEGSAEGENGDEGGASAVRLEDVLALYEEPQGEWRSLLLPLGEGEAQGESQTEPWFDVSYDQLSLPLSLTQYWSDARHGKTSYSGNITGYLGLPPRNSFLPSPSLSLISEVDALTDGVETKKRRTESPADTDGVSPPSLRVFSRSGEREKHCLWHRADTSFSRPKAEAVLDFASARYAQDARSSLLRDLSVRLLEDYVNETVYLASTADLHVTFRRTDSPTHFALGVSGFSDKCLLLAALLGCVFLSSDAFVLGDVEGEGLTRLERAVSALRDEYANKLLKSEQVANGNRLDLLVHSRVPLRDKLVLLQSREFTDSLTPEVVLQEHTACRASFTITAMVQGNVRASDAESWFSSLLGWWRAAGPSVNARRSLEDIERDWLSVTLSPAYSMTLSPKAPGLDAALKIDVPQIRDRCLQVVHGRPDSRSETNSACEVYFMHNQYNAEDLTLCDLLESLLMEPFFDQMRTKQQMGYSVSCGMRQSHGRLGFAFKIVSSSHSLEQITSAIMNFAFTAHDLVSSFSVDHVQSHIDALIDAKLQPDLSLSDRTNSDWSQISEELYDFTIKTQQVRILQNAKKVSRERMITFAKDFFVGKCRAIVSLASPVPEEKKEMNHNKVLTAILKKYFHEPAVKPQKGSGKGKGKQQGSVLPEILLFVDGESMQQIRVSL